MHFTQQGCEGQTAGHPWVEGGTCMDFHKRSGCGHPLSVFRERLP